MPGWPKGLESGKEKKYIPGSCNIGPEEINRRYRIGYIGLALSLIVILCFRVFDLPRIYRLFFLFTTLIALTGFIQARMKFCLFYGWKGMYSMTGRRHMHSIQDAKYVRQDRLNVLKMALMIGGGSILATLIFYCL